MTEEVYVICLSSRHTGETCWLGAKHPSKQAAMDYAEKSVCKTCNRVDIYRVPSAYEWRGLKDGFGLIGHC